MALEQIRKDIVGILKKAGVKIVPADIVFPPDQKMGDLSLPLFVLAKERKMAPGALAQELSHRLQPQGLVERIEIAGPYLNFWLKKEEVTTYILSLRGQRPKQYKRSPRSDRSVGARDDMMRGKRIMMEMVSPNNNKPLHLGHLRNAFLGESVSRLLESQGAKVVRACLFNDRGLHIAKAMVGYKLWAKGATPETAQTKGDQFVVQWYVLFEKKAKEEQEKRSAAPRVPLSGGPDAPEQSSVRGRQAPALQVQAEELVRKWEEGDKETIALWKKMAGWAMDGLDASLARLGMKFNVRYFESTLWKQGKKVVEEGLKRGIFKKDETGAVIVDFKGLSFGAPKDSPLPPKVLRRADGTAIYATADLALTTEKFKKYKLDRAIWCVGQEQDLYLKQLFAIMTMLGYKWADRCEHLSYGLVHLPEGRMKTREGTVVEADPLLDHLAGLVKEEIKARHARLTKREIEKRAEIIAQAAVRYYFLKVGPKNSVNFDPKASISFTGDTGPYLLYTYARIASILRKSEDRKQKIGNRKNPSSVFRLPSSEIEWSLILLLAHFPEIIAQAADTRDPSHLAKYLFELAQTFSAIYEKEPVLKAEEPTRSFRLALISTFQKILKEGLRLLTIETVEEM